ncbi:TraK family protein [Vibrio parahaemolyticus]|uniref:TraK family protein n=1 Tax=Vibrio parahaemolyticus TaxID=670 RepID=UPI00111F7B6A|nr:TraK family protein [Vibrio parahaemolyticus]EFI4080053.1 conjugal transfer protein TraK [Escherichia coli]EIJ6557030.1 TraK family protein [Salmonella enterica]MVB44408.1 conjugal transfer protein TraK [Vibrio cholerae]EGQ8112716.1 conjugal transfer protein TraK [Vibrio parahaemolyticus]MCR9925532.1 TraK family protein [Vibrio parahaemolyticus]
MGKFTDGLEKWVQERDKRQKKRRQDASAVEFLAVKKDVAEAIEAGYSLKTIWEYLKEGEKVRSTYETFRRHVKRFIKSAPKDHETLAAKKEVAAPNVERQPEATASKAEKSETEGKEKPQLPGTGGFKFDAKPNKEDLI